MIDPFESYVGPSGFPSADCTPPVFPDPVFSDCPDAYIAHEGEIDEIYITNVVFDTGTSKWKGVVLPVSHTVSANFIVTGIERLVGFGDKPLAEVLTVPLPKNQIKNVERKHTLNFDFTDQPIANYTLIRALQGSQRLCFWYKTIDGDVFGGASGIIARVINAGNVHSRGENALLTGTIILGWDNMFDPPRDILDPPAPLMVGVQPPEPLRAKETIQTKQVAGATV